MTPRTADRLGVGRVERRLLRVGLPLLVANGVMLALPILAYAYLGAEEYATWALLMTVVVASLLFDLGGTAYIQSAGYGVRVGRRLTMQSVGLSVLGVTVVTGTAIVASALLAERLSIPTDSDVFVWLVVATGLAAAIRAVWSVMLSRLQVSEQYRVRTRLSISQSVVQVALCWLGLAVGVGLWTLPITIAVSTIPFLVVGNHILARRGLDLPEARPPAHLASFASIRTLSALVGTLSSQADRWVLASFAPATFLSTYDLALRLAALPLGVVVTLFGGIIAEGAAAESLKRRRELVRRSTVRVGAVVGALSLAGYLVVLVGGHLGFAMASREMLTLLGMALIWMGANALTAPTTMTYIGVGKPANELRYTVPALVSSAAGWTIAVALADPWLVPISSLVAVTSWSIWFSYYGIRWAKY